MSNYGLVQAIMQVRRVNYEHMRSPILAHAPTSFSRVTKLCMLQLRSRQGMRWQLVTNQDTKIDI